MSHERLVVGQRIPQRDDRVASAAVARKGVGSTLIGARTVAQLESNIATTTIALSDDQMQRLDAASAPVPGFSASLAQPGVRRMVFGGHSVAGWGER